MKTRVFISAALLLVLLAGCRAKPQESAAAQLREFPYPTVPAVYTDPEERRDWVLDHFWDAFLAGNGPCDTGAVLGVRHSDVEGQVALYAQQLEQLPLSEAQKKMRHFFSQVEERQAADTASHVYLLMEEIVSRYLYDPNSPVRNEDLYLPYVEGLAASRFTREEARPGYVYEARMCALAPVGSVAPDFRFTDARGRTRRLHDVQARAILLFFSNPGCYACLDIINTLEAIPGIRNRIARGDFAVVNVYIDEDLAAWRAYEPNYPRDWFCGYDPDGLIRSDRIYNVRAIPSLYLLDAQKRILMKDAPVDRVVSWLQNQQNQ
jgi:Peroxiredoxin